MRFITGITILFFTITIFDSYCYAEILGDINNDNQVNTKEAIYALQVSAGIENNLTIANKSSLDAADGSPKDALYVDNDGKVGIGTTSPSATFTLNQGSNSQFSKKLSGLVTIAPNSNTVIGDKTFFTQELKTGVTVLIANEFISISSITSDTALILSNEHKTGAFNVPVFSSSDVISVYDSNKKATLILDNAGNLGIGTDTPGSKLDINGFFIRKIFRNSGALDNGFDYKQSEPVKIPNKYLTFNKSKDNTAVKIEYSDYMGVYDSCGRCIWEIRVDGKSCPNYPLYFSNYQCLNITSGSSRNVSFHNFKGYCEGVKSGVHEIQIWVHKHEGYLSDTKSMCRTGTNDSTWTIEAQEVY